ncbi:HEAT repeat domain-containing protein [Myxococcaceae bacterium GXIMD 01537]
MSPAFLLMMLLAASPRGGSGAAACLASCQRHMTAAPGARAQVCRACVTDSRPEAWMEALARSERVSLAPLRSARSDGDWRVRWAAIRAEAQVRREPAARTLAQWVASAPFSGVLPACITVVRAAAASGQTVHAFLEKGGPHAREAHARVAASRLDVRSALELELFSEEAAARAPALLHLAVFLGHPPARVALDAMASRPATGDASVASALLAVAEQQRTSVGRALLAVAKPPDEALVNRLFAIYSVELDGLRRELSSPDVGRRRAAVLALRRYGPLARQEFLLAQDDLDGRVRQLAVEGLGEAESVPVLTLARERLRPGMDLARERPWLAVVARTPGGAELLLSMADDPTYSPEARGEAVARLGECEEGAPEQRRQRVERFLRDVEPRVRAGAVRAIGALGRSPAATGVVTRALEDAEPEVLVAALQVAAAQRQAAQVEAAARLLGAPSPEVRAAAARALEVIGREPQARPLAACLKGDAVAPVRVAAAQALGEVGGTLAVAALTEASQRDAEPQVRRVARESLKRLGFVQR